MADEQYLLEDLEDEGEEVDYDELTLDDDFLGTHLPTFLLWVCCLSKEGSG